VPVEDDEILICGGWERIGNRMVPDASLIRIQSMVAIKLERIADCAGGWETLFRDRSDGRLWERFYPSGEMHGGGPESLRRIDMASAEKKYAITLSEPPRKDPA
jgi:hypothetical protein